MSAAAAVSKDSPVPDAKSPMAKDVREMNAEQKAWLMKTPAFTGLYALASSIPIEPLRTRTMETVKRFAKVWSEFDEGRKALSNKDEWEVFWLTDVENTSLPSELVYRICNWYMMNPMDMDDKARDQIMQTVRTYVFNTYHGTLTIKQGRPPKGIKVDRRDAIYTGDVDDLCRVLERRIKDTQYQYMRIRCAYLYADMRIEFHQILIPLQAMAYRLPSFCTWCKKEIAGTLLRCKTCGLATYCGQPCKDAHTPVHRCTSNASEVKSLFYKFLFERCIRPIGVTARLLEADEVPPDVALSFKPFSGGRYPWVSNFTFGKNPPEVPKQEEYKFWAANLITALCDTNATKSGSTDGQKGKPNAGVSPQSDNTPTKPPSDSGKAPPNSKPKE